MVSLVQEAIFTPSTFLKFRIKLPIVRLVYETVALYKTRTIQGVDNIRQVLFKGTIIAFITALLVWLAVFMYIAFYYMYIPTLSYERPIYLQFSACEATCAGHHKTGICSFPNAHIQLSDRQRLLMLDQSYKIYVNLEMPESERNKNLGMFMVCASFRGKTQSLLANSCRSTMLRYHSPLLDYAFKALYFIFYLTGRQEEKQDLIVELFSDFKDEMTEPVTDIFIQVQTTSIDIYSATMLINAHFTGLKFLMYRWPLISAAIGVTSNMVFIAIVCMISWYQIVNSEEYQQYSEQKSQKPAFIEFDTDSSSTSFLEDVPQEELLGESKLRHREFSQAIETISDADC